MILYNILAWFEVWGVPVGVGYVFLPIAYDLVGILYGRDLHLKIETAGVVVQLIGGAFVLIGKYAKRWGR